MLEASGVTMEMLDATRGLDGERRPLRVPLGDPEIEAGADEHGTFIRVAFDLPAGSFATAVMREIMQTDAMEGEGE